MKSDGSSDNEKWWVSIEETIEYVAEVRRADV